MKFHWEDIQRLAKAHHCEDPVVDTITFRRYLEFWWCRVYSRPLKDPLLKQYTLDELTYEYLRHLYHEPGQDPRRELESKVVKSEDDQWIKEMMAKVKDSQAILKKAVEKTEPATVPVATGPLLPPASPTGDPEPLPEALVLPDISTKFDE